MPELPEIVVFAGDVQKELVGRAISGIEVLQPKRLNVAVDGSRSATGSTSSYVCPTCQPLKASA